jgi:hypothetical protein
MSPWLVRGAFCHIRHSKGVSDDERAWQFCLEEFKLLRSEIAADAAEIARVERFCATACAVIWAWLFAAEAQGLWILSAIPTLVSLYGLGRAGALYDGIQKIASYIRIVEKERTNRCDGAWECYIDGLRQRERAATRDLPSKIRRKVTLSKTSRIFWTTLIIANIVLAAAYNSNVSTRHARSSIHSASAAAVRHLP